MVNQNIHDYCLAGSYLRSNCENLITKLKSGMNVAKTLKVDEKDLAHDFYVRRNTIKNLQSKSKLSEKCLQIRNEKHIEKKLLLLTDKEERKLSTSHHLLKQEDSLRIKKEHEP